LLHYVTPEDSNLLTPAFICADTAVEAVDAALETVLAALAIVEVAYEAVVDKADDRLALELAHAVSTSLNVTSVVELVVLSVEIVVLDVDLLLDDTDVSAMEITS